MESAIDPSEFWNFVSYNTDFANRRTISLRHGSNDLSFIYSNIVSGNVF